MVLDLSLGRIGPLLRALRAQSAAGAAGAAGATGGATTWPRVVHIAGTNGKGSVSAYVSYVLAAAGVRVGRFNSPHLVEARDSIQVDNRAVDAAAYAEACADVARADARGRFGCTEFELLTATALSCFARAQCAVAVLEVGVGGRDDATNAVPDDCVAVCGITKVGMDHVGLLGGTLAEIASHKVGILKRGVPAVIDGSNDLAVVRVAEREALSVGCPLKVAHRGDIPPGVVPGLLGDYQWDNLALALGLVGVLAQDPSLGITSDAIRRGVAATRWPGRLQRVCVDLPGGDLSLLLDGAHNPQAAIQLRNYLDSTTNETNGTNGTAGGAEPRTFVLGFTAGKDVGPVLDILLRPGDSVVAVEFSTPVEGMPWIAPVAAEDVVEMAQARGCQATACQDIGSALSTARDTKNVVTLCGSLYLVADVLRMGGCVSDVSDSKK